MAQDFRNQTMPSRDWCDRCNSLCDRGHQGRVQPQEKMMEHPIAASAEVVSGKGWETILLVEDEAFVREVTGEVLAAAGYTVLKAGNAEEALWTFCRHEGEVHLLLTDVVMPGKNGRDLAAELRSLSPRMKTIVTSGYGESVSLLDGGQDSTISFLAKPFSVQSLMQKIREMLDENQ